MHGYTVRPPLRKRVLTLSCSVNQLSITDYKLVVAVPKVSSVRTDRSKLALRLAISEMYTIDNIYIILSVIAYTLSTFKFKWFWSSIINVTHGRSWLVPNNRNWTGHFPLIFEFECWSCIHNDRKDDIQLHVIRPKYESNIYTFLYHIYTVIIK